MKYGRDFTLAKIHTLYYLYYVSSIWYNLRLYENHRFFDDFPTSNNIWHLSWFIATSAYDVVCPELGVMPIKIASSGELSM